MLPNDSLDPIFLATVQATEEAVVNAMVAADTMTGADNHTVIGLPHDRLREVLKSTIGWKSRTERRASPRVALSFLLINRVSRRRRAQIRLCRGQQQSSCPFERAQIFQTVK